MTNRHSNNSPTPPRYQLDELDVAILRRLQVDGRRPYLDIARELGVAGGTVHQRMKRLEEAGVVRGTALRLDRRALGLDVTVLVGLHLNHARAVPAVLERLAGFPEVRRVSYTTGTYSLIVEVSLPTIAAFHAFLIDKLQAIEEIRATESFVCLDDPIDRDLALPEPTAGWRGLPPPTGARSTAETRAGARAPSGATGGSADRRRW